MDMVPRSNLPIVGNQAEVCVVWTVRRKVPAQRQNIITVEETKMTPKDFHTHVATHKTAQ